MKKLFKLYSILAALTLGATSVQASQSIFTDPSAGTCSDLAPTNTGGGTCSIATVSAFNQSENITFTATTAGPTATFSVVGSVSGTLGTIQSGATRAFTDPYGFPRFSVTLSDSGTNYVVGDNFRVTITAGSELKAANFNLFDLSQVCSNGCTTTSAVLGLNFTASGGTAANHTLYKSGNIFTLRGGTSGTQITTTGDVTTFLVNDSGVFTIGSSGNSSSHTLNGANYTIQSSADTGLIIQPTATNKEAYLDLHTPASSTVDSYTLFRTTSGTSWVVGKDTSDSNAFAIALGTALGTTNAMRVDSSTRVASFPVGVSFATSGGTPTTLDYYEEGTFSANFNAGAGAAGSGTTFTVAFVRVGKVVTLTFPNMHTMTAGATATNFSTATGTVASRLRPSATASMNQMVLCKVNGSDSATPCQFNVSSAGALSLYRDGANATTFTSASVSGAYGFAMTYSTQ